jgi:hydrogenase-4 component F
VDTLGGFFLITVAGVTVLAAFGSIAYLSAEEDAGTLSAFQVRLYFIFFGLFASLMLASLETGNLGLLFVLVEASTLASAALVGLEGKARSLEAAWKYVIISSLGVTIALAGTLFLFYAGSALHLTSNERLTSSVEHMGIIAVALGFGGVLGLYGALLHTLNHAIAKAVLFLGSGDVALRYRTREAAEVRGLLAAIPVTGGALLLGSLAVLGSPPFGLFLSELTIVRAGFSGSSPLLPLLLLALLAVAFIAFARTTAGMVTGQAPKPPDPYRGRGPHWAGTAPLAAGLVTLLVLGLWIPAGLNAAILHSMAAIR